MKLYSKNLSPFAARARMAVYAKGLDVEILDPPGGLRSDAFRAVNPMGKVPCLVTEDGTVVPESDTIVEFLEDLFPDRPLRPASPEGAARDRLLARVGESYVMGPISRLFGQMDPAKRDPALVDAAFADLDAGLGYLEALLSGEAYAGGKRLGAADCQLAPTLFFVRVMGLAFRKGDPLAGHPRVTAYMASLGEDPVCVRVWDEQQQALTRFRETGEIT